MNNSSYYLFLINKNNNIKNNLNFLFHSIHKRKIDRKIRVENIYEVQHGFSIFLTLI